MRVWFPIDKWVNLLWLFPLEPAHAPQYLFFFGAGLLSFRNGWLQAIPKSVAVVWSAVGLIGAIGYCLRNLFGFSKAWFPLETGGWNRGNLYYSLLESFVAVGVSIALLALFQRRFNGLNSLLRFLSASAFGVYFIHILVVVPIQMVLLPPPGDRYRSFWWRPPWPILSPI
ncbi:MAG: acyltransferase family protein [Armatimonas sp.]